jgi:hypothetical protein
MPGGTPPRTPPRVYSPNGSIENTYIATHSPYTVHTAHIQPYTAIHIPHTAHTAHIQAPRRHAVYIQCVYSPYRCIQNTYIAIHSPYTVHTAHIQPYTAIHSPYIAHTAHVQASRRHTDYIRCVHSPYMPMPADPYTAYTSHRQPYTVHIQSIYSPYTVHTQHMRIPVYSPCAVANARAGGIPVDSTRNPSGTRGPGMSAGPRHLDEVERKSARFLFLGRTPQHPLLRRRQTLAAFASSLCSLS